MSHVFPLRFLECQSNTLTLTDLIDVTYTFLLVLLDFIKGKLGSPVFTNLKSPRYITAYKNQDVTLKCDAVGDTPITITWSHQGNVLQSKTNGTDLILSKVNSKNEGFYNCKATNTAGANNKDLYLRVKGIVTNCQTFKKVTPAILKSRTH